MPVFSVDPIEAAMWRNGLARDQTGVAAYDVAITLAGEFSLDVPSFSTRSTRSRRRAPHGEAWPPRHRANLKIIECVCADQTVHRRRIEARVRNIEGMPEVTWARVLARRAEYQDWTDARLILDTSAATPENLLAEALNYLRRS